MSTAPRVYAAIAAVTADLARCGIPKSQVNAAEQYSYRSIDEVCERLAPILARHRLCVLPRVLERESQQLAAAGNELLNSVWIKIAYEIVSARDGSSHTIEVYGEALDGGDKATSKAMSSAYKQAMLQLFCAPVKGTDDTEKASHRLVAKIEERDPDNGWDQWLLDMQDMIRVCETVEALDRVQQTYRGTIRSSSKRRPDVFSAIGKAMSERRTSLTPKTMTAETALNGKQLQEVADA